MKTMRKYYMQYLYELGRVSNPANFDFISHCKKSAVGPLKIKNDYTKTISE